MGKLLITTAFLLRRWFKWGSYALMVGLFFLTAGCLPVRGQPDGGLLVAATQPVEQEPSATVIPSQTASATPQPSITPTATRTPTATQTPTPTSTPTITFTPPPLPVFNSRLVRPDKLPQTYLADPCAYLRMRWSVGSSQPGTVVIPVMFHGIRESGKPVNDNITISEEQFDDFVRYAQQLGYQTITTAQLAQFLEQNAPIPARSLLLIIDDRRPGTVETYFLPVLEENGWTATLAWIIADTNEALWQRMEKMAETGLLDIQSHGYLHRYLVPEMNEEDVREEITASIPILEAHFGNRPIAFIWPGGNYSAFAVQVAREAGFKLGFTANSNGPLMFNWIPLGEAERAIGDPLMVLPRAWSTALNVNLDWAAQIGDQARAAAIESYPQEAAYYRTYCGGELPALEQVIPEDR